jgi:hypothetical protein
MARPFAGLKARASTGVFAFRLYETFQMVRRSIDLNGRSWAVRQPAKP